MKVKVVKQDITSGVKCDGEQCPVARAIARATAHRIGSVVVESESITIYDEYDGDSYYKPRQVATPESVRHFVNRFDQNLRVKPFEFELDVEGVTT